nr:hypothetical protein [Tanacetum cinerariifolium]
MVTYLMKSDASEGFNQVIDFLNGSHIKLQVPVDRKKVVITEDTIRDALRLDDAEGVDCLPNEEIFAELARMGYEKPSTKLTFYKAFFSSQWKFIQLIIKNQLGDLLTHTTKYISPTLTQKVFANIRRVRKGFSGVETPLFEGMIVAGVIEEEGAAEECCSRTIYTISYSTYSTTTTIPRSPINIPSTTLSPQSPQAQPQTQSQSQQATDFPMSRLQEALDACAALTRRVEHLKYDKVARALEIKKFKKRVKKLEKGNKVKVLKLRRLRKVGTSQRIKTSDDTVMEDASNQGRMIDALDSDVGVALMMIRRKKRKLKRIRRMSQKKCRRKRKGVVIRDPEEESSTVIPADTKSKDKGKGLMVEEPKPLKKKQHVEMKTKEYPFVQRYQVIKKRLQTEAQAQKNMIMYLKNVAGFRLLEEEENRAIESINETPAQKAAKRRKLNEEVEDLKRHLEIVPDEDDDVYTEATPLARKLILLVERRYPLSRFTLDQMLNAVRLRVEEQSEMSLELLRFTRQQHQEGQLE